MLRCARCGTDLEPDERFCGNCGAPVPDPAPPLPAATPPVSAQASPPSTARPASVVPWIVVGCLLLFFGAGAAALGAWWWLGGGAKNPLAGSTTASPTATASAEPAGLEELAGAWTLEDAPEKQVDLQPRDGRLVATNPSSPGEELRILERRGEEVRGEYRDVDGSTKPFTGSYRDDRITLTIDGETGTLVRPGAVPPSSPPGVVLFQDRGDLDGDGAEETAVIVDEDGTTDPLTPSGRHLEVRDASGRVVYRTETWEVPFRPDLDHLAGGPENTAGVHVVPGSGPHPDIRVVFVPASEDFATWRYDGVQYGLTR